MRALRSLLAATAASCIGAALLIGSPAHTAAAQPSCTGTQTTLADGTTICTPQERESGGLLSGGLLGEVLAPGADGSGTTTCSPGAVITVLGRTTTCPAATAVPATPAPGTVIVTPPTARQSTVISDLVVTH